MIDGLPEALRAIPADVPGLWETLEARFEQLGHPVRVVIHGGYGKNNTGDDALLHVIRGRVLAHFPNAEIHVVCHGPERVAARYPGELTTSHFKSLATVRAALRSDLYIIGGGGIVNRINAYSGNMVFKALDPKGKFQFFATLAAGAARRLYALLRYRGRSFPTASSSAHPARRAARHPRERARPRSIANLRECGVTREIVQVLDPALSSQPAPAAEAVELLGTMGLEGRDERNRPLVGMNFRWVGDPAIDNEHTLSEAARVARELNDRGYDVVFLPISQHTEKHLEDDVDFGRRLGQALGAPNWFRLLETYPHPTVMMALLGQCDALVLSRLHAIILATMMGVPIAVVSYDDKVTEFVKLAGRDARMIQLDEFTLERLAPALDATLAEVPAR